MPTGPGNDGNTEVELDGELKEKVDALLGAQNAVEPAKTALREAIGVQVERVNKDQAKINKAKSILNPTSERIASMDQRVTARREEAGDADADSQIRNLVRDHPPGPLTDGPVDESTRDTSQEEFMEEVNPLQDGLTEENNPDPENPGDTQGPVHGVNSDNPEGANLITRFLTWAKNVLSDLNKYDVSLQGIEKQE